MCARARRRLRLGVYRRGRGLLFLLHDRGALLRFLDLRLGFVQRSARLEHRESDHACPTQAAEDRHRPHLPARQEKRNRRNDDADLREELRALEPLRGGVVGVDDIFVRRGVFLRLRHVVLVL